MSASVRWAYAYSHMGTLYSGMVRVSHRLEHPRRVDDHHLAKQLRVVVLRKLGDRLQELAHVLVKLGDGEALQVDNR